MSSPKYASPLAISIVPSRLLLAAALFMHIGAAGLIVFLELPLTIRLAFLLLLITSALAVSYYAGWVFKGNRWLRNVGDYWPRFERAVWDNDDRWLLTGDRQKTYDATLLPTTFVHPKLVIVNLLLPDMPWYSRYRSMIFVPDNIDPQTFRRLRIRLRWYSPQALDNSAALK